MRVFLTGATGWIGSAVAQELIDAGHSVVGLVRSEKDGAALATGITPLLGSLSDLDALRRGAGDADGVIHTEFGLDFSKYAELPGGPHSDRDVRGGVCRVGPADRRD